MTRPYVRRPRPAAPPSTRRDELREAYLAILACEAFAGLQGWPLADLLGDGGAVRSARLARVLKRAEQAVPGFRMEL